MLSRRMSMGFLPALAPLSLRLEVRFHEQGTFLKAVSMVPWAGQVDVVSSKDGIRRKVKFSLVFISGQAE